MSEQYIDLSKILNEDGSVDGEKSLQLNYLSNVFGKIQIGADSDVNKIQITPEEYLTLLKFIGKNKIVLSANQSDGSISIEHEKNFESPKTLGDLFTLDFKEAEKKLQIIPNFKSDQFGHFISLGTDEVAAPLEVGIPIDKIANEGAAIVDTDRAEKGILCFKQYTSVNQEATA